MKSRIVLVFVGFIALWVIIALRAGQLQVLPSERLESLKKRQFKKAVTIRSRRGAIMDRNGKELAVSVAAYSLYADPKIIANPKNVARRLARELRISPRSVSVKISKKSRRFVWIKRHLSKKQKDAISAWNIRGLAFIEEPKRVYPNEKLLSQVLGFVGSENQGLEGLERKYESALRGETKKIQIQRDARGRPLLLNGRLFTDQPDGANLELTIDAELQFILERELANATEKHDADAAVGVILDAKTSEILAMANTPTFNLNRALDFDRKLRRNRAVTDAFEPGSTLKTFVVASALKNNVAQANTRYNCEDGRFKVGNRYINEADQRHTFGWLSVSEILAHSSNIGVTKIGLDLGAKRLRQSFLEFGFGEKSGVDLPGEAVGILHDLPWRDHLLSNISFGHGLTVTPLQVVNAYAAIANGGYLKQPFIVKRVANPDTGESFETEPKVIRRVLEPEQAHIMSLMLTAVTSQSGTGYKARIPGYPVAGKTGTAQKVNPDGRGYLKGAYISSFAGFVPANDPQFVIYIAVDNPRESYYGSQVAAPIFARVGGYAVRKSGLSPVLISQKDIIPQSQARKKSPNTKPKMLVSQPLGSKASGLVPDLIGASLRDVYRRIGGTGIRPVIRGSGLVIRTHPGPGERVPSNRRVRIELKDNM